jgi:hypothetical protein
LWHRPRNQHQHHLSYQDLWPAALSLLRYLQDRCSPNSSSSSTHLRLRHWLPRLLSSSGSSRLEQHLQQATVAVLYRHQLHHPSSLRLQVSQ